MPLGAFLRVRPGGRGGVLTDEDDRPICPRDYDIVRVPPGSRDGRPVIDALALCDYLADLGIVYDGSVPYYWDGRTYVRVSDSFVERAVNEALELYDPPVLIDRAMLWKVLFRVRNTCTADRVGEREELDPRYYGDLTAFDNALVDVLTGDVLPFTRHRFITNRYAARWDPSAPDGGAAAVISSIIPDPAARRLFFEQVGYILFSRDFNPPAVFLTYGKAGTGKTALQRAVVAAMGEENVSTLDIGQISSRFGPAELDGKMLNICGETGSGRRGAFVRTDGELIKRLSDGQTVTVERKGRDPYQMRNRAKLWFITNTYPDFGDSSSGMSRRLHVLRCNRVQDPTAQLHRVVTTPEASAWLVARAAEAYRDFVARGRVWTDSEELRAERALYWSQNPVRAFLEAYEEAEDGVRGRYVDDVYSAYRVFCADTGVRYPVTMMQLVEFIRTEMGVGTNHGNMAHRMAFDFRATINLFYSPSFDVHGPDP